MSSTNLKKVSGFDLFTQSAITLKAQGLKTITVTFDGSGDDGCIQDFECVPNGFELNPEIKEEVENAAIDLMVGSFDNDGGGGTMEIDLENMRVEYHEYFYETVQEDAQLVTFQIAENAVYEEE